MLTTELITAISEQAGEPKELLEARLRALEAYLALPAPILKYGRATSFAPASVALPLDELAAPPSVSLSAAGAHPRAFAECMRDDELRGALREYGLAPIAGADKIDAWHDAVCADRLVLRLTETVREPIAIAWHAGGAFAASELLVIAEEGVAATLIETASGEEGARLASRRVRVVAKAGASVEYRASLDSAVARSCAVRQIGIAHRGARVIFANAILAGEYVRLRTSCLLAEEGAGMSAHVAHAAAGSEKRDLFSSMAHLAPRTVSSVGSRGIVSGGAKSVARDLIAIGAGMAGCQASQSAKALTLSDAAETHVAPLLEIATDEVACSHSASVGKLDEEQLFFLMSRGLSRGEAAAALIDAFLDSGFGLGDDKRAALAGRLLQDSSYGK